MGEYKPEGQYSETESAELSLKGSRNLEGYKFYLRIKEKDLANKEILDLGSGPYGRFAEEVEKKISGAKVTSFDYSFEKPAVNKELGERVLFDPLVTENSGETKQLKRVRGLFTKLPFAPGSFDVVVSSAAMPLYLNNSEQIKDAFQEVIRILKEGGRAYIGPVAYGNMAAEGNEAKQQHSYEDSSKLFREILDNFSGKIKFEFLPPSFDELGRPGYPKDHPGVLVVTKTKPLFKWKRGRSH